jgi:hypothetical protein
LVDLSHVSRATGARIGSAALSESLSNARALLPSWTCHDLTAGKGLCHLRHGRTNDSMFPKCAKPCRRSSIFYRRLEICKPSKGAHEAKVRQPPLRAGTKSYPRPDAGSAGSRQFLESSNTTERLNALANTSAPLVHSNVIGNPNFSYIIALTRPTHRHRFPLSSTVSLPGD